MAILFTDGFESGVQENIYHVNSWNGSNSPLIYISSDYAHAGTYSCKVTGPSVTISDYHNFASATQFTLDYWVYIASVSNNYNCHVQPSNGALSSSPATWPDGVAFRQISGSTVGAYTAVNQTPIKLDLSTGQWIHVEIAYNLTTAPTVMDVWINGSHYGTYNCGNPNVTACTRIYFVTNNNSNPATMYYDDMTVLSTLKGWFVRPVPEVMDLNEVIDHRKKTRYRFSETMRVVESTRRPRKIRKFLSAVVNEVENIVKNFKSVGVNYRRFVYPQINKKFTVSFSVNCMSCADFTPLLVGSNGEFSLANPATWPDMVELGPGGDIAYYHGGAHTVIDNIGINTWSRIDIQYNLDQNPATMYVSVNSTKYGPFTCTNNVRTLTGVSVSVPAVTGFEIWIDDINIYLGVSSNFLLQYVYDLMTIIDDIFTKISFMRIFNEGMHVVGSIQRSITFRRTIGEIVRPRETTTPVRAMLRVLGTSVLNILASMGLVRSRSVSEIEHVTETNIFQHTILMILSEIEDIIESIVTSRYIWRFIDSTVSILESTARSRSMSRIITNVASLVDHMKLIRIRVMNEIERVVDMADRWRYVRKSLTEVINLVDTRKWTYLIHKIANSEALHFVENLKRRSKLLPTVVEILRLTEARNIVRTLRRRVSEILNLVEKTRRPLYLRKKLSENESIVDASKRPRTMRRRLAEVMNPKELSLRYMRKFKKLVSDVLHFVDTRIASRKSIRRILERVRHLDTSIRARVLRRRITEAEHLLDTGRTRRKLRRSVSEITRLYDILKYRFKKVQVTDTDEIYLYELIIRAMKWRKRIREIVRMADKLTPARHRRRNVLETERIIDNSKRRKKIVQIKAELLNILSVSKIHRVLRHFISVAMTLVEFVTVPSRVLRPKLKETVSISEFILKRRRLVRVINEIVYAIGTVTRAWKRLLYVRETVRIKDKPRHHKKLVHILVEALNVLDGLIKMVFWQVPMDPKAVDAARIIYLIDRGRRDMHTEGKRRDYDATY